MKKVIFLCLIIIFTSLVSASAISPLTLTSFGYGDKVPVGSSSKVSGIDIQLVSIGKDNFGKYADINIDGLFYKIYEKKLFKQANVEIYITRIVDDPVLDYVNWYVASESKKGVYERKWFYDAKEGDIIKLRTGETLFVESIDLKTFNFRFNNKKLMLNRGGYVIVDNFQFYLETINFDVNTYKRSGVLIITYVGNDRIKDNIEKEDVVIKPEVCDGCFVEGECLNKFDKNGFFYCNAENKLVFFKMAGEECSLNVECENNKCVNGFCFKEFDVKEETGYYFRVKGLFWNFISKLNL